MANKNNHPVKAAWRDLTDKQIKELPATKQEAYDVDSKYYFTGKPCKYGHVAPKTRANRYCVICKDNKEKGIPVVKIEVETHEMTKSVLVMGMKLKFLLNKNKD